MGSPDDLEDQLNKETYSFEEAGAHLDRRLLQVDPSHQGIASLGPKIGPFDPSEPLLTSTEPLASEPTGSTCANLHLRTSPSDACQVHQERTMWREFSDRYRLSAHSFGPEGLHLLNVVQFKCLSTRLERCQYHACSSYKSTLDVLIPSCPKCSFVPARSSRVEPFMA